MPITYVDEIGPQINQVVKSKKKMWLETFSEKKLTFWKRLIQEKMILRKYFCDVIYYSANRGDWAEKKNQSKKRIDLVYLRPLTSNMI